MLNQKPSYRKSVRTYKNTQAQPTSALSQARRSAAEVEADHKRRGLRRITMGLILVLAIALVAVGGFHINEHIIQKDDQPAQIEESINYEKVNRGYSELTKDGGYYYNPKTGLKETWYSQNVLPGGGLSIEGRHVNDAGIVCDGNGYIVCASSDYEKGTVIVTSLGTAKVYDTGCPNGVLDIYTAW